MLYKDVFGYQRICDGTSSCNGITISCPSGETCEIICNATDSCKGADIYGDISNSVVIECSAKSSCENSKIYGPINEEFTVTCTNDNACQNFLIDGRYSSKLELLDCATGTAVCGGITVWCPPNNNGVKICTLNGDKSFYGASGQPLNFYGINGFADFNIIITESKDDGSYYGTMHCLSDYRKTCDISSFGFYCDNNGDATCDNPILYQKQLIYSYNFSALYDWNIEDPGGDISFRTGGCPTSSVCIEMSHQHIWISRIISTIGYHSIRVQFDMASNSLESGDECYVGYRSSEIPTWIIGWNTVQDEVLLNESFNIINNSSYNNQSSFELRFAVIADSGDHCRYDNLKVYGKQNIPIPSTNEPSQSPSTQEPSATPTESPSTSEPSISPSTSSPTYQPSIDPTADPTAVPSTDPTAFPSMNPSSTSVAPSIDPSNSPSIYPTSMTSAPSTNPTSPPQPHIQVDITPSPTNEGDGEISEPTADPTQAENKRADTKNQLNNDIMIIIALGVTIIIMTICVIIGFICICHFNKKKTRKETAVRESIRMSSLSSVGLGEVNNQDNHKNTEDFSEAEHDDGIQMSSIASMAPAPLSIGLTHEEKHYTKGDEQSSDSDGNELFVTGTTQTDNGGIITAEGVNDNIMQDPHEIISEDVNDNDEIYEKGDDLNDNVITGGLDIATENGDDNDYDNSGESGSGGITMA